MSSRGGLGIAGLALGFLLLLVAIVVAADQGCLPSFVTALYAFPGGDKVGHFVLMGILGFLVNLSLASRSAGKTWHTLLLGTLALMLLVTLEEISQQVFRTRHASWIDLLSSYAGIVVLGYGGWLWGRSLGAKALG
jgi:polysaccharide biosynthesis protein VpsQ